MTVAFHPVVLDPNSTHILQDRKSEANDTYMLYAELLSFGSWGGGCLILRVCSGLDCSYMESGSSVAKGGLPARGGVLWMIGWAIENTPGDKGRANWKENGCLGYIQDWEPRRREPREKRKNREEGDGRKEKASAGLYTYSCPPIASAATQARSIIGCESSRYKVTLSAHLIALRSLWSLSPSRAYVLLTLPHDLTWASHFDLSLGLFTYIYLSRD